MTDPDYGEFECVDADGNVYPEHTEDMECRRCGAEMEQS